MLSREEHALLDAIARRESGGQYNVIYGGGHFSDFSDHPRQYVTITSGPHKGEPSSAAGKYQILASTYDRVAPILGITDFSPESQDKIALYLAQEKVPNLSAKLRGGDQATINSIANDLHSTWTSLPGGIEATQSGNSFTNAFNDNVTTGYGMTPPADIPAEPAPVSRDVLQDLRERWAGTHRPDWVASSSARADALQQLKIADGDVQKDLPGLTPVEQLDAVAAGKPDVLAALKAKVDQVLGPEQPASWITDNRPGPLGDAGATPGKIVTGPDGKTYQSVQTAGEVGNPTAWGWEERAQTPTASWIADNRPATAAPSRTVAPVAAPQAKPLTSDTPVAPWIADGRTLEPDGVLQGWNTIAKPVDHSSDEPNYVGREVPLPSTADLPVPEIPAIGSGLTRTTGGVAGTMQMPAGARPGSVPTIAPWLPGGTPAPAPAPATRAPWLPVLAQPIDGTTMTAQPIAPNLVNSPPATPTTGPTIAATPIKPRADVAQIQQVLNSVAGTNLAIDGLMGPQTDAAIRAFQKANGLTVDGIVGPQTSMALQRSLPVNSQTNPVLGLTFGLTTPQTTAPVLPNGSVLPPAANATTAPVRQAPAPAAVSALIEDMPMAQGASQARLDEMARSIAGADDMDSAIRLNNRAVTEEGYGQKGQTPASRTKAEQLVAQTTNISRHDNPKAYAAALAAAQAQLAHQAA